MTEGSARWRSASVAGPLPGREGILYADCDLGREIVAKQIQDIVGTYQRSDIFQLVAGTRRHATAGRYRP